MVSVKYDLICTITITIADIWHILVQSNVYKISIGNAFGAIDALRSVLYHLTVLSLFGRQVIEANN